MTGKKKRWVARGTRSWAFAATKGELPWSSVMADPVRFMRKLFAQYEKDDLLPEFSETFRSPLYDWIAREFEKGKKVGEFGGIPIVEDARIPPDSIGVSAINIGPIRGNALAVGFPIFDEAEAWNVIHLRGLTAAD